ncbi:HAD hydrolase-like protein [Candidatus Woesearchaeota archaeon]|nr:HAD hydrolase-like protein [Candidatus Woesearchaeota archaeon]
MPVSMMVRMEASDHPILLRFVGGKLNAMEYHDDDGSFLHRTAELVGPDERLLSPVIHKFKKPNPEILTAVIQANVLEGRVRHDPRVLMVGDRYLTDIVAGNLADVDTALVRPFRPLTDKLELIAVRYALDLPLGTVMRNIHALSGSSYALPY